MAFNGVEKKALSGLAMLYASRMLGLFMVLPVLALYGQSLTAATPMLLGIALGIYGLTQAFLQIPFGTLSDHFGRKPLIIIGLIVFFLGSAVAALSENVFGLIVGRALQGAGAISSVVLALLADYTRETERSKAMAVIGAVIGASFVLAVVLGPIIAAWQGLEGIFWFTSLLALIGLLIVARLPEVPKPKVHKERQVVWKSMGMVVRHPYVVTLSAGIFVLHASMTALFVGLPLMLVEQGVTAGKLGWIYAPVMIVSFIAMVPMMMRSEKQNAQLGYLVASVAMLIVALVLLATQWVIGLSIFALWLFFVGFNFIEATLPSLLSRRIDEQVRGTAMGFFATGQFVGAAVGGIAGGYAFMQFGFVGVVIAATVAQIIWSGMLIQLARLNREFAR